MRAVVFILAACVLLPAASAGAGQCTSEIDNLAKQLASRDAGSGPTAGVPASSIGQHPPTSATSEADRSGAASARAAQSDKPQHPPTAVMNREATGSAGTIGSGQPSTATAPASGAPETKEQPTPSATMNRGGADARSVEHTAPTQGMGSVSAELERARMFDQQGKEEECLRIIGQAKQLMTR
jgi:hypothetical protein